MLEGRSLMLTINLIRTIALGVFIGLLMGCASRTLNVHVGQTVADVINQYGEPTTFYDMPDGRRAYLWQKTEVSTYGGVGVSTGSNDTRYSIGFFTPFFGSPNTCIYTYYATQIGQQDSPMFWKIVGFKKPNLGCQ